jgi:phytol kinase
MTNDLIDYSDFIGLAASYSYAIALLLFGEGLGRLFNVPPNLTRKIIHVGAVYRSIRFS